MNKIMLFYHFHYKNIKKKNGEKKIKYTHRNYTDNLV